MAYAGDPDREFAQSVLRGDPLPDGADDLLRQRDGLGRDLPRADVCGDAAREAVRVPGRHVVAVQDRPALAHLDEADVPLHGAPEHDLLALRVQEGLQSLLGDLLGEEARQVVAAALGQVPGPAQVLGGLLEPATALLSGRRPRRAPPPASGSRAGTAGPAWPRT